MCSLCLWSDIWTQSNNKLSLLFIVTPHIYVLQNKKPIPSMFHHAMRGDTLSHSNETIYDLWWSFGLTHPCSTTLWAHDHSTSIIMRQCKDKGHISHPQEKPLPHPCSKPFIPFNQPSMLDNVGSLNCSTTTNEFKWTQLPLNQIIDTYCSHQCNLNQCKKRCCSTSCKLKMYIIEHWASTSSTVPTPCKKRKWITNVVV